MILIPAVVGALLQQQAPQPPEPIPANSVSPASTAGSRLDQVELATGEVLEGRIVQERGNYLEIELGPGAVVGFRTNLVAAVRHGAGAVTAPVVQPSLPARDEWFRLCDGSGVAVGWLHGTTVAQPDGSVVLQEEWEFQSEKRQFQVTRIEVADRSLAPLSCYFRERCSDAVTGASPYDPMAGRRRIAEERIVEAAVEGDHLTVHRLTAEGRTQRRLPWAADSTFPLLANARRSADPEARRQARELVVFDGAVEDLQVVTFAASRSRTVPADPASAVVDECTESCAGARNTSWIAADGRTLRREIAGPGLVATAADPDGVRAGLGNRVAGASLVVDSGHRMGIWRPNPIWEAAPAPAGSIALHSSIHDASITLSSPLPLDGSLTLDAAADGVQRWLALQQPGATIVRREHLPIRDRDAVRIESRCGSGEDAEVDVLHVVPRSTGRSKAEDGDANEATSAYVVLHCRSKAAAFAELSPDFDAVAARLELVPVVIASLLPPAGSKDADAVVATAPPLSAAMAAPAEAAAKPTAPAVPPRVRVPSDQDATATGR